MSSGHVVFGAGCSCGAATIAELLATIGRRRGPQAEALTLLADLERSIDSFEEMHRGRGS